MSPTRPPASARIRPPHRLLAVTGAAGLFAGALVGAPAVAAAAGDRQQVDYRGVHLQVPADWPVYRLGPDSTRCVRFDRHAVYLGSQGPDARCPARSVGISDAVQLSGYSGSATDAVAAAGGAVSAATSHRDVRVLPARHVLVTTTSAGTDPAAGTGFAAQLAAQGARQPDPAAVRRAVAHAAATRAATAARADAIAPRTASVGSYVTGKGFDACTAPSTSSMRAWLASEYRSVGIYIGGANRACGDGNLSASWVTTTTGYGWHLIPIYVGLQAPCTSARHTATMSSSTAVAQGTAAADDAAGRMAAFGLAPGNPVYFDLEAYGSTSSCVATVNAFLQAWTVELHRLGFTSGVYSSSASGIRQLVRQVGTGFVLPDDIWAANWNETPDTVDPYVPARYWSHHQRLHQYRGGHNARYGGVTINIDSDYVDGALAPGLGRPGAPASVTAVGTAGGLAVSWSAPPAGTSPVTGYEVTVSPGGTSRTLPATSRTTALTGLTYGTGYAVKVTATNAVGTGSAGTATGTPLPSGGGSGYTPLPPTRVLDTRSGIGGLSRLDADTPATLTLPSSVPSSAVAAVLNVAVTGASGPGHLLVARPGATGGTNVSYAGSNATAGLATTAVGTGRTVSITSSQDADVVADLVGYYGSGGSGFHPLPSAVPVLDTRSGLGGTRVLADHPITLRLHDLAGVPASAAAVMLAVTGRGAVHSGTFRIDGAAPSATSTLNLATDLAASNQVISSVGSGASISLSSSVDADARITVLGWFGTGGDLYHPLAGATRLLDTRVTGDRLDGGADLDIPLGTVPSAATELVTDLTVTGESGVGSLSDGGVPVMPYLSNRTTTTPALLTVDDGAATVTASTDTDVLVDVSGYFAAS